MRDFTGWGDLIERMAAARREGRDNAPKQSNDHQEAGMFLAMLRAFDDFMRDHFSETPEPAPGPSPAPVAETPPVPVEPSHGEPAVVTDEPQDTEPEEADAPTQPQSRASRPRRSRTADDGGEGDQSE